MFNRDKKIFDDWVRTYRSFLYRAAWALTRERGAAQDIVQETFTLAWRARKQLREEVTVQAWLYRILRREAFRSLRQQEPWVEWDDEVCGEVAGTPDMIDLRIDLLDALQSVTPLHREMLVLYYLADMSYEELALAVEVPVGTVMSRLNRARSALRTVMMEGELQ
jgi:RNA polymerase sigma-70 factor (ECF subfamily)